MKYTITTKDPLTILVDADMVAFRGCAAVQREIEWDTDLWTLHANLSDAIEAVDTMIESITTRVLNHYKWTGEYRILMVLSSRENFRKDLYEDYKANRKNTRKPVCYQGMMNWIRKEFDSVTVDPLEADDTIGILATTLDNTVMVSGDKDFKSIPGRLYNFLTQEFSESTKEQADRYFLYQTLLGDSTDNYKGCPGIGKVSADKLLDQECSWDTVVAAYRREKLTEEDALVQARLARILRSSDWDPKNQKVILWTPRSYT